jgi:acetate kinase
MKILVINTGSSSIKFRLFKMADKSVLASGLLEKIGEENGTLTTEINTPETTKKDVIDGLHISDHQQGMAKIVSILTDKSNGAIQDPLEISGVGHRVVHGGEDFKKPALINDKVLSAIKKNSELAPLHNPANLTGIEVARSFFPDVPHIAVFDTAFHHTLPPHAFHYALPPEYYDKYKIRRYGFHGSSHQYVTKMTAQFMNKPLNEINIITIHLGNGASMAAVKNGECIDTSMGMTPLEGLIMGTRSGDMDPAIIFHIQEMTKKDSGDIQNDLNKKSGLKGICGENDMRQIIRKMEAGDEHAKLALTMYSYRIKKYIGAYYAALGKLDAVVFTAGIGENSPLVRELCIEGLEELGIILDKKINYDNKMGVNEISDNTGKVKILVVPTNEELEIALQTKELLDSK